MRCYNNAPEIGTNLASRILSSCKKPAEVEHSYASFQFNPVSHFCCSDNKELLLDIKSMRRFCNMTSHRLGQSPGLYKCVCSISCIISAFSNLHAYTNSTADRIDRNSLHKWGYRHCVVPYKCLQHKKVLQFFF